ncbi:MAG: ATP-binding protein [bacterium]
MMFQRTTVRARFELASGAFALIMLLPALGGWWSLRSISAAADRTLAAAMVKQNLSLRLVSSTMRAVQTGTDYVSRPSPELRTDFERLSADAHSAAAKLNRDSLASADEAELIAHLDRQLSVLESELDRAHVHVDLGEREQAIASLATAAPLEAIVMGDVERLGTAGAAHVAAVTTALRRSADSQILALVLAIVLATMGLAFVARWVSRTVALPLSDLLAQAVELGKRNASARTPPDSLPDDFRPLAVAMNEAALTLTRVTMAEERSHELLARQNVTLEELRTRSTELQDEVALRRRAEAAAREARHRADAANRAKSDFLARMSHELRTPLNSVIGFASVLLKNKAQRLQDGELQYLGRIDKNGRHLLHLIDNVLDLSKIESGRMVADCAPTALDALIRDTLSELGGRLLATADPDTPPPVVLCADLPAPMALLTTDHLKLKQMVINLVANALKFTERGTVTVRVVTDAVTAAPLRIDVMDTGPGIPLDRQDAVFEAFEQESNETASKFGGTGLGLAITRAFADLLGYHVTIESTVGVGSTFSIVLVPETRPGGGATRTAGSGLTPAMRTTPVPAHV